MRHEGDDMSLLRAASIAAACAFLTACPTTAVRPPEHREALPAIRAPDLRGATIYMIDSQASDVQVQVFRAGTFARLGHNHVMTSKHVTGRVWSHPTLDRSGFELEFPVAQLIVDDSQARAAAGSEFPGEIPADDREGTRKNMLRAEVLDAQNHPTIKLQSVKMSGSAQQPEITTRITIKGVARDVSVPAAVAIENGRLTAAGQFDILQSDFGIKPFSVGGGTLQVQDRLHIAFKIVART
jgi:polyisoprenoid-binding protein YceI